jgi:hypothetical protein
MSVMPPLVFLRVYDAISAHRVVPLALLVGDTWHCTCGCIFQGSHRGQPNATCPRELIWARAWPGAYDRWWERWWER